jgi:hypothetical protein
MYNKRSWTEEQHQRLEQLLSGDAVKGSSNTDTESNDDSVCTTFEEEFAEFVRSCHAWSADGVVPFFNKYSHVPNLKVLRRQRSGLCFMHAPIVLQYYLISIYNSSHDVDNN